MDPPPPLDYAPPVKRRALPVETLLAMSTYAIAYVAAVIAIAFTARLGSAPSGDITWTAALVLSVALAGAGIPLLLLALIRHGFGTLEVMTLAAAAAYWAIPLILT